MYNHGVFGPRYGSQPINDVMDQCNETNFDRASLSNSHGRPILQDSTMRDGYAWPKFDGAGDATDSSSGSSPGSSGYHSPRESFSDVESPLTTGDFDINTRLQGYWRWRFPEDEVTNDTSAFDQQNAKSQSTDNIEDILKEARSRLDAIRDDIRNLTLPPDYQSPEYNFEPLNTPINTDRQSTHVSNKPNKYRYGPSSHLAPSPEQVERLGLTYDKSEHYMAATRSGNGSFMHAYSTHTWRNTDGSVHSKLMEWNPQFTKDELDSPKTTWPKTKSTFSRVSKAVKKLL